MNTATDKTTTLEGLSSVVSSLIPNTDKASAITSAIENFCSQFDELKDQALQIEVNAPDQTKEMKAAKELRLSIRRERLAATDVIKSKREEVKARMADDKAEDTAWLRLLQYLEDQMKPLEESLEKKEKFAELYAIEQMQKKRTERGEIMAEYAEYFPVIGIDLGVHTDEEFDTLVQTAKGAKESTLKRQEEERIAKEKEQKEEQERKEAQQKLDARRNTVARIPMVLQEDHYFDEVSEISITLSDFNSFTDEEFERTINHIKQNRADVIQKQNERKEVLRQRQSDIISLGFNWNSVNKGYESDFKDSDNEIYFFPVGVIEDDNVYQTEFDKAKDWIEKVKASIQAAAEVIPVPQPEPKSERAYAYVEEPTSDIKLATDKEMIQHFLSKAKELSDLMRKALPHFQTDEGKRVCSSGANLMDKVSVYLETTGSKLQ